MRLLSLLAIVACSDAPGTDDSAAVDPSAWSWASDVQRGPPLSAAQVEAALPALLGELRSFHGVDVVELYLDHMALRQEPCPYIERTEVYDPDLVVSEYWYGDECTTEDGVYFDGYSYSREYTDRSQPDGLAYSGLDFKGEAVVIEPDGATFIVGGFAYSYAGLPRGNSPDRGWLSGVQGSVTWTGAGHEGDWFTTARVAEISMEARLVSGRRSVLVEGGVAGFEGDILGLVAGPLVALEASPCPQELGGKLALRDAEGRWYALSFDGATSEEESPDMSACDGCGALSLDGEALGSVCVSPDPLLDWGASPW